MKRYFAWVFFVLAAVNTLGHAHGFTTGNVATLTECFANPGLLFSFLNSIIGLLVTAFFYWLWYRWKD